MENKKQVEQWIEDFVRNYPQTHDVETRWKTPLVAVADAADPLYLQLKTLVGPNHAMPEDILPGAKSVIVYFIPFAENIVQSNVEGEESSREWDYAYIETNALLGALGDYLYEQLTAQGHRASRLPSSYNYDEVLFRSDWSHKSSAYIAGLGTFGINQMIITAAGCCGRLGSIITDWVLTPTLRPQEEYCPYKKDGSCGLCMQRCPNAAYRVENGRVFLEKKRCNEQIYDKIVPQWPIGPGDTCGKCACGLPCSFRIP